LGITETVVIVGPLVMVVVEPAPPPPQPATKRLKPIIIHPAACQPNFLIQKLLICRKDRSKPAVAICKQFQFHTILQACGGQPSKVVGN
jgi:hypothetical protein